jgi:hypothetical protein
MHYVIFAIVPKDVQGEDDTKSYIDKMMQPFCSDTDDPRYATHEEDGYMYNPNGHWDWYRPGGRWGGRIIDNYQSSGNGFNWDDKHETVANNRLGISDYLNRKLNDYDDDNWFGAFGIVYQDGEKCWWIDRYLPGWETKTHEVWDIELSHILEQFKDCDIVSLDCHK